MNCHQTSPGSKLVASSALNTFTNLFARRTVQIYRLLCLFTAMVVFIGCGREMKVAPVSGILTLDGEPIEKVSVVFEPEQGGRPSFGVTDTEGKYSLAYSRTLNGAEVGDCVVKITKLTETSESEPKVKSNTPEAQPIIPKRYLKEPVKVTVLPRRNVIHIDLTTEP